MVFVFIKCYVGHCSVDVLCPIVNSTADMNTQIL